MPPKKRVDRYKLHKFVVQAILIRYDDSGEPVGEAPSNPVEFFNVRQLHRYADDFPSFLADLNNQVLEQDGLQS